MKRRLIIFLSILFVGAGILIYSFKDRTLGGSEGFSTLTKNTGLYSYQVRKLLGRSHYILIEGYHQGNIERVRWGIRDENNDTKAELIVIEEQERPDSKILNALRLYRGTKGVPAECPGMKNPGELGVVDYDENQRKIVCRPLSDPRIGRIFELADLYLKYFAEDFSKSASADDKILRNSVSEFESLFTTRIKDYPAEWHIPHEHESHIPASLQAFPNAPAWMLHL